MYHMVNSQRPLEEKMALFWHHVFATGNSKVDNCDQLLEQLGCSASVASATTGTYCPALQEPGHDLLAGQQREPPGRGQRDLGPGTAGALLDGRQQLHRGRCPEASRAFTGWTITPKIPRLPYAGSPGGSSTRKRTTTKGEDLSWGHTGNFNGEDIIDIIIQEPATARFISRHL